MQSHNFFKLSVFILSILLPFNLICAQDKNTPRKCIVVFGAHADDVESIAGGGWLADDSQSNGRGKPDVRIDVKDYLKIKYAAYDKHVSQNGGLERDYVLSNKKNPSEYNDKVEEFITVVDNTK